MQMSCKCFEKSYALKFLSPRSPWPSVGQRSFSKATETKLMLCLRLHGIVAKVRGRPVLDGVVLNHILTAVDPQSKLNCHHGHKKLHGRSGSKVECWSRAGASNSGRLSAWVLKITFPHSLRSVSWGGQEEECVCMYFSVLPLSVYVCGAAINVDNNELLPTPNFRLFYSAFVFFFF